MGGKRNQKKKKKKSWRAMLDGCFHKPVFDRKDSQDSKDSSQDSKEILDNTKGMTSSNIPAAPQCQTVMPSSFRMIQNEGASQGPDGGEGPVRVRGILKKSPTSSSVNSGVFTESNTSGLVYYNPIYSDVSSSRPSNPHDSDNASNPYHGHGAFYHGAMPQQIYSGPVRQQAVHQNSVDEQRGIWNSSGRASTLPTRFDDGRQIAESWEGWKAEYLESRDRQRKFVPQGILRHSLENRSRDDQDGITTSTGQPRNSFELRHHHQISPNENRWSFPVTDLRNVPGATTTSNPYGFSSTRPSGVYSSPVSPSAAKERYQSTCQAVVPYSDPNQLTKRYQSAFMQQQRQQQQQQQTQYSQHQHQQQPHLQPSQRRSLDTSRDSRQFRPISAPASPWTNTSASPSHQNRKRHYSENFDSHRVHTNTTPHSPRQSDYSTRSSAGSRLNDPIRKPMGSHFCPYSNPIYGLHGAVAMGEDRSQSRRVPQSTGHYDRRANTQLPVLEKENTGYNVSHIYATVCRTDSKAIASSCIYTSFSWQKGPGDSVIGAAPEPGRFHPLMALPPLPPPMMPLGLPVEPGGTAQLDHSSQNNRPQLPSYDEIVRYRNNNNGRSSRPNSWSESDLKETERKREAFMTLLAQRYPQYADRIHGGTPAPSQTSGGGPGVPPTKGQATLEKPARSRDPQRRRQAPAVIYDPRYATNTFEYEDLGTMSDLELPSFQRGGFTRTSLPIVRSASTSLERPLGLVFLVYGSQTKKSLLPNELTTLDTVRALFVRAFPDLTMEMMETPRRKIYVLDQATNIYFQLEDLGEIKDRSVVKLHETDDEAPQKVRERTEVRGRTVQVPLTRAQSHQETPEYSKSHTLPAHATAPGYPDPMQQEQWKDLERRSRSRTPEPLERQRYSRSPERFPPPDRGAGGGSLNPIPENRQVNPRYRDPANSNNYYETIGPHSPNSNYSRGGLPQTHYDSQSPYAIYTAPHQQQAYIARSTRASTMIHPQRAIGPTQPDSRLSDIHDGQRPSAGMSTPATCSSATVTPSIIPVPADINGQLANLKSDLQVLKRQTQLNVEAMREEFMKAANTIKAVISSVPGAENQVNFHNRVEATKRKTAYLSDKVQVDHELSDLESSVEELRNDIINHQCRVQLSDVEGMALLLSNITKNLADLKTQFPEVHEKMKEVMNNEMQLVVAEENFLKEEPTKIEKSLMRCKKLTGTLYTLKRLASVQDHRPPQIPNITSAPTGSTEEDPKKTLLENIRALVPDHDRRVHEMEAGEAARLRKKKISTQKEALKFGKSLEMVSKNLRPCSANGDRMDDPNEDDKVEALDQMKSEKQIVQETPVVVSSQNIVSANPTATHSNYKAAPETSTPAPYSSSSAHSASSATPTVTFLPPASSSSSVLPSSIPQSQPSMSSYSANLGTATISKQPSDKPTATVSAMPSNTSTEIPRSVTSPLPSKPPHNTYPSPSTITTTTPSHRSATLPLTEMTERLSNQVQTGTGPATQTVSTSTDTSKKSDASVSTLTSSSEVPTSNTFRPAVFTKPPRQFSPTKSPKTAPLVESEDFDIDIKERPKSSGAFSPSNTKTPPVSKANSLDSTPTKSYRPLSAPVDSNGQVINGHTENNNNKDEEKSKPYRKAARSAFSSSWVSPPSSPTPPVTSPKTNPLSINSMAQIIPGGTINLVLSGVASPKSPTNPGTFTITPPTDIATDSIPHSSPSSSVPASTLPKPDTEAANKQKKVPPPPPPRRGSRPSSMTNLPTVNGGEQQQQQEMPQFVGGILGQHRLSGGPLSSTPKQSSQQKALSTFEKDIASGIYANLNRPDLQNQTSSPQQMLDKANSKNNASSAIPTNSNPSDMSDPPLSPMVSTSCVDRNERGSSSESSSSSNSGTSSMGSQQSVAGVMRSSSVSLRSSNKPKPEPPKRHSSLLSKNPVPPPDTRVPARRKTLNGVDL